jgi:NAD+ diphosphatase
MEQDRPNFFAGPYIDRRAEERDKPQWLAEAGEDPATRYLIAQGTAQLLLGGDEPHIALLPRDSALLGSVEPGSEILLGWFHGARCLLAELPAGGSWPLPPGTELAELRPLTAVLPADEAGLLAYARALLIWRARHRHCGVCGAPTAPTRAGHCLVCTNMSCAQEYFPRIDPAIIVLVRDGERDHRCALGSQDIGCDLKHLRLLRRLGRHPRSSRKSHPEGSRSSCPAPDLL